MKITVNGVELYYEVYGEGRPLLMIHGNSEDHTIFNEAAEVLKERFQVYLIDSRDHGQSEKVSELHYADMAQDLLGFMDALDLKDVVFYGFSDGGILGLLCAQKTDRITKLIISGANMTPKGVKAHLRAMIRIMYLFTRDGKMKMMLKEPHITSKELGSIQCPSVVIAGEKDLVNETETREIALSIPDAKLMILPGEGHGSYIVHQTRIADLILKITKE